MNLNLTPVTDEKIPASLTKDYLDEEAKKATREDFDKVMRAVPDAEAAEYDKL